MTCLLISTDGSLFFSPLGSVFGFGDRCLFVCSFVCLESCPCDIVLTGRVTKGDLVRTVSAGVVA